jgi:hypothetical protein
VQDLIPFSLGRENIYNNGTVLGLTHKEIDEVLEEIIDFSELREFIDTPVQNYSSGMKVRLGFAVATSFKPDVLILDEVLAVGDAGFRMKSFNRISEDNAYVCRYFCEPFYANNSKNLHTWYVNGKRKYKVVYKQHARSNRILF